MKNKESPLASCQLPVNTGGECAHVFNWQLTTNNWQLSPAFTLIELMISVALVIVLMVGIGKIFKMTSDTVGGGMAIDTMARGDRAAQVTMENDFAGAASDSPVFMILSERVGAWVTPQDKLSDLDGDPMTMDGNNDGKETAGSGSYYTGAGDDLSSALYGDRNHRIDRIGFFARGQFSRQTSNDNNSFTGAPGSTEAYIWYGHVRLPGTCNVPADTPDGPNTYQTGTTLQFPHIGYKTTAAASSGYDLDSGYYENNPIATNWVLGRVAILLRDESTFTSSTSPYYYGNPNLETSHLFINPPSNPTPMSPLGYQTIPAYGPGKTTNQTDYAPLPNAQPKYGFIYRSRYDLAGTTISGYRSIVSTAYNTTLAGGITWWWPLVYNTAYPIKAAAGAPPVLPFRFECNPYVSKPITGTAMAQSTPYFMPHVTQFIVEFAGDYLTQDDPQPLVAGAAAGSSGYIEDVKPDGKLDFYYDKSADISAGQVTPSLWVRRIRWYGFPRDIGGYTGAGATRVVGPDGRIPSPTLGTNFMLGTTDPNSFVDVLPFGDIERMSAASTTPPPFTEVEPLAVQRNDYATPNPSTTNVAATVGVGGNEHYYCIWRNAAPKLVRILLKIDDPNGRVRQGRWVEQVFAIQ